MSKSKRVNNKKAGTFKRARELKRAGKEPKSRD